jgi:serine/threonine-protein kinase
LDAILAQPKRIGLLVYLVTAVPGRLHRLDELLAIFWPELDEGHARNALSQAAHALRVSLGHDVIAKRGKDELGANAEAIWCDATAFERYLAAGHCLEALSLYRGPFLRGFFLSHAPDFERWVEQRGQRLQRRAIDAALVAADQEERKGNLQAAVSWMRRATEIAPASECMFRRLAALLNQIGDRGEAVKAYQDFARRLRRDFDLEPSRETRPLIDAIRSR